MASQQLVLKPSACSAAFDRLVDDLLVEIATFLPRSRDIRNFCLTSRRISTCALHVLYTEVHLSSAHAWSMTMDMLLRKPNIACYVQKFTCEVVEDVISDPKHGASGSIARLAPSLPVLRAFDWGGDEAPRCDDMWEALRMHCKELRTIGVSAGREFPRQDSFIYKFTGLTSFTMRFDPRIIFDDPTAEGQSSLSALWVMLIERCPDLENLALTGSPLHPIPALRLARGRWPKLRSLALGALLLEPSTPQTLDPGAKRPFIAFLEAHPTLRSLQLPGRRDLPPVSFASVNRAAFPPLEHFGGSIFQSTTMRCYTTLRSLHLTKPLHLSDAVVPALCAMLDRFRGIEVLCFEFVVNATGDHQAFLRAVFETCPQLVRLQLTMDGPIQLIQMTSLLPLLPKLRSFVLSLKKAPEGASVLDAVRKITLGNALLEHFTLTFAESSAGGRGWRPPGVLFCGKYEVVRDHNGRACTLIVREHGEAPHDVRRHTHDLSEYHAVVPSAMGSAYLDNQKLFVAGSIVALLALWAMSLQPKESRLPF